MPKLRLYNLEINLTKEEAEKVSQALLSEVSFLKIGNEIINSKFIVGIFESNEPEPKTSRLIEAPKFEKQNLEKISEILFKMKKELMKKGIIRE